MQKFNDKTIGIILMMFSSFGLVFGFLATIGIVSTKYVWGGRITDHNQLIKLEITTLIVNVLVLWVIAMRTGMLKQRINAKIIRLILIILMIIMALNTFGNIFAQTLLEKFFAIPTLISTVGFYILVRRKQETNVARNN